MAGTPRRRLASGGAAWAQSGATTPGAAWTDPYLWAADPSAASSTSTSSLPINGPVTGVGMPGGVLGGGNGQPAGSTTAAATAPGGYMPTVSTVASDMGISPSYGKVAQALLGFAAPPLGIAMTGYGLAAQANNTANNAAMLGRMGDPLSIGQILGGVAGLNGYGGTPEGAMNAAMGTDAGRQALSTSQLGGVVPGVSMPTQTAPTVGVTSEALGDPNAGNKGDSGNVGNGGMGPSGMAGTGGHGMANGTGGEGGLAHGGRVRGTRGKPATNVVIVMPHPIMGALMLAALHNRMAQPHAPMGALQAARR